MNLTWIASPLTLIALSGAGMAACVFLFVTLKKEIAETGAAYRDRIAALETALKELGASLDQLKRDLAEAEARAEAAARPVTGMNLNKRGQALRMHRRGETPDQIAAALGVPVNEVELLLKVHRTLVARL